MIDPALLRESPDVLRESQRRRGEDVAIIDTLIDLDIRRRAAQQAFDEVRAEQKQLGKRIGPLQGRVKKDPADIEAKTELDALMAEAAGLADRVKDSDAEATRLAAELDSTWLAVSNVVDDRAPVGDEADFTVLDIVGEPRDFTAEGFPARDHIELGEILGAIDIERAAKVSGSRFYFLTGVGALLELALLNLAIARATAHGFTPVVPPVLVSPNAMEGTGFLGQAAENVYRIESDDMYLVGTAEVPLAAMHSDEILPADSLPLRYVGWSSCFRREAGTYGKDTRGIIRVHQFDKVEMFVFTTPEEAEAEHQRLLAWERQFMDDLELPYRVIDVATGDLGASAARKFDIEAWIPTQGAYREVTSTSNTTQFQARRLRVRLRDEEGTRPVATLNGTLCAMPRIIVALLENHQQPDGSVRVPAALQQFLGREVLAPAGSFQ
jgi:seryl-tRNA synthetase